MPFLLTGMALNLNFMAFERGVLQGRLFVYVNAVMHTHTPNILFSEVWLWAGEKIVLGLLSLNTCMRSRLLVVTVELSPASIVFNV